MKILTFDIEDWFHLLDYGPTESPKNWDEMDSRIENNTIRILDCLDEKGVKGTFFCLGWVANKYPDLVKEIVIKGHEVGTHSYSHQLIYKQSPIEYERDLVESIESLLKAGAGQVEFYRAPGFSLKEGSEWVFDILIKHGITVDCSIFPTTRAHGGYEKFSIDKPTILTTKNGSLREFPINACNYGGKKIVFSGGGYFRLLPYNVIKHLFNKEDYVMTYFHPRDFDNAQPKLNIRNPIRKFKTYCGLRKSFWKFQQILDEYKFISVGEAVKNIDWDRVLKVRI